MGWAFVADRPSLNFAATLAERGTTEVEQLRDPADLAGWIGEAGLAQDVTAPSRAMLTEARALREALYRLLRTASAGSVADADTRDLINAAAARPGPVLHLDEAGRLTRTGGLPAALTALALDGLSLLDSPDLDRLTWCSGPRCTRGFIDRSRARNRRWCDMTGCGDRAKVATYRQRRRT